MASGFTNRGLRCMINTYFRADGTDEPDAFKLALVTDSSVGADINTLSQLSQLAEANGYLTGGKSVARTSGGFDNLTEDDANDLAYLELQDVTWDITDAGIEGVRFAVLVDDAATPNVIAYLDLNGPKAQDAGQPFTVKDARFRAAWSA